MLVKTFGSALQGVDALTITIEVNAGGEVKVGSPNKHMVGLPDSAVREGFHRIEAAIKNIGYKLPYVKIVVNLAPADIRKEGSYYDLPIAMGMLYATKMLTEGKVEDYYMMGELSLDGTLRPIKGALPIAIQVRKDGFDNLIVPFENAREAAIVNDLKVY